MTTPTHKEYNIATMMDIARIPPDRIPALLQALPRCLDTIRPFSMIQANFPKEMLDVIAKSLIWKDDGIEDGSQDELNVTFTTHTP